MAQSSGVPSPTGGWVTNKPKDAMLPNEALVLENYIAQGLNVKVRRGSLNHITGLSAPVESLMEWNNGASAKLLVASGENIFDGLTATAVSLVGSLASAVWQHVNFKGRLFAVNGIDDAIDFDGTDIDVTAWTGIDTDKLINISVFKNRLFFVEKDTAKFWYAQGDSILGALASFDLSMVTPDGGKLVATATFTRDGGEGSDDLFIAIFETGDLIMYQGDDPSSADSWGLVGRYKIAPPIGYRCVNQVGGDLCIITEDGYISLGTVIGYARSRSDMVINFNIANYVRDLANRTKDTAGWQATLYYRGGFLLFNAPTGGGKFEQHCVNMTTGAWFKITGWNGICWSLYKQDLYFGTRDGRVVKADTGYSDNGSNIKGHIETAFNYLDNRGIFKLFKMIRPLFTVKGSVPVQIGINVDYKNKGVPYLTSLVDYTITPWGSAWGSAWSPSENNINEWKGVSAQPAYCCSLIVKTDCQAEKIELNSIDVIYEAGGGL
jgi:hypothetical protein